jgi:di/tricarboxylate transporter
MQFLKKSIIKNDAAAEEDVDLGTKILGLDGAAPAVPPEQPFTQDDVSETVIPLGSEKEALYMFDKEPPKRSIQTIGRELLAWYWGMLVFFAICIIGLGLLGGLSFGPLSWKAWFTFAVIAVLFGVLIYDLCDIALTFLFAVTVLLALKIIDGKDALSGFSNTGVATVAVLYAVAEGINRTNGLYVLLRYLVGKPKWVWIAQLRLFAPMALISAFVHNTPLVAMANPIVQTYCRRRGFPVHKFLMPMNAVVLLGGISTTIGTSTNLIVVGLVASSKPLDSAGNPVKLGFFALAPIGAVISVIGVVYSILATRFLLKGRKKSGVDALIENPREYTVALKVEERASIVGETVREAGLRSLEGLYLIEITRVDGEVLPAVAPETKILAGDTLLFAGIVDTVRELYHISGLVPATPQSKKIRANANRRRLVELVVSSRSDLINTTPKQARFRSRYGAVIIAVHRRGDHVREKIGEIALVAGDAILVETSEVFVEQFGKDPNFALVSEVSNSQPKRDDYPHMIVAMLIMVAMTVAASGGAGDWMPLLSASAVAAFLMIATGCCTWQNAAKAIDVRVMLTIAASFGVANALDKTGAAGALAKFVLNVFKKSGNIGVYFGIYIATAVITNIISNNAAATLMYPVVLSIAKQNKEVNIYSALYTLMLAASASFSTPIGYQTNLMVHSSDCYSFADWAAFGVPLQFIVMIPSVYLVDRLWH